MNDPILEILDNSWLAGPLIFAAIIIFSLCMNRWGDGSGLNQAIRCLFGFHSDTLKNCEHCGKWVCKHPQWENAGFWDDDCRPYAVWVAAQKCTVCGYQDVTKY